MILLVREKYGMSAIFCRTTQCSISFSPLTQDASSLHLYSLMERETVRINPLSPKISLASLLTVCYTIHLMLVWRIWNWINQ